MPITANEFFAEGRRQEQFQRTVTADEFFDGVPAAGNMGQTWVREDINAGNVNVTNYMQRAADKIQEYQQARSDLGESRLTANEQVAIVDAYRQMAGLQPEGWYMTKEGAAVPRDRFAEIRRKRTEDDAWENFKANISGTVLQNLAGIRAAQAQITDSLGITENALIDATRESEEVTRILQPLGGKSGFAGQAVGNVMNLFLAAGQAPAMFATSTAGSTFIDVAQRREAGQEISPYTEWTAAIANATVEYALESFGQSVARRAGAKLAGRIGDIRSAIAGNGLRGGIRTAASLFVKHGFEQAGMALEGAAEEGITQILQNTVRRLSYAEEQDIFGGVGEAALQGAIMPILAAGPMAAIQRGRMGGATPEAQAGLPPIPPSQTAGDQTISDQPDIARIAKIEKALRSEETLPDNLRQSLPTEADIPDIRENSTVGEADLVDKWIGDRQLAETKADIEARNHRRELKTLLREGEQSDQIDAAIAVYIDMKENSDSYTAENIQQLTSEQQILTERAQSLSPDQQAFADQIIAENKALGIEAMEAGIIQNFKENYSARFWKKGDFPGRKKGKFTISTPRQRQRTLPSLIEGWAEGMELEVPGALEAQMLAKQQIAQVIHDRNLVALGLKSGLFNQARTDEHTHRIKHPNFAKWVWTGKSTVVAPEGVEIPIEVEPRVKLYGKDVFTDNEGNIFKRASMYANKETARFLNNALGSSIMYNWPGVGKITKYNSIIKQMILTAALFHHQAYLRSYTLASRGINPVKAYQEGKKAIENFVPELQELVHEGLTIGKILDFDPAVQRESTIVGELIDKVPMASGVRKALRRLSKANTDFLFGKFGPYLKTQAALLDYRYQLKKNKQNLLNGKITRQEIAANVANLINDDFGGLNLQRMGRNPTAQHILRLLTLAPDWTESNIRTMVKAFKRGHEGKIYRAMWGRVLAKGIGATVLFNILMSAFDDEKDFFERYEKAWKAGNLRWLDVDITPLYKALGGTKGKRKYLSLVGHFRDPVKFLIYPARSAKNKSSVLGRMVLDSLTGTDWRGREFTSIGDLMRNGEAVKPIPFGGGPINPEQYPSFIIKQAEQSTPVQAQSLIQWLRGEIDGFDAITRGAGILTGTTYPPKRKKRKQRTRKRRK